MNRYSNYKIAKDITCNVNPMSYINIIEHSKRITNITYTEVAEFLSSLKSSSDGM